MGYSGNVVTDLPDWTPPGDIIAEPPSDKKANGWQVEEFPPAQWRNWFDEGFYQSIKELDTEIGNIQDGTTTVGEASNADTLDNVHLADIDWTHVTMSKTDSGIDATTVGGQTIPDNRFQISSNLGSDISIDAGTSPWVQRFLVYVPSGKSLVIKRVRFAVLGADRRLLIQTNYPGTDWQSSSDGGDVTPNHTLSTSDDVTHQIDIYIKNVGSSTVNVSKYASWWVDFSIE